MNLTRKEFLSSIVSAVAGTAGAAVLIGCSDDSPSGDAGIAKSCTANGGAASIGSNHGHTLTVSAADVNAAVDKTYNIQGTSPHPHMITITAAQFNMLKGSSTASVTVTSTSDGSPAHTHSVTVTCA